MLLVHAAVIGVAVAEQYVTQKTINSTVLKIIFNARMHVAEFNIEMDTEKEKEIKILPENRYICWFVYILRN